MLGALVVAALLIGASVFGARGGEDDTPPATDRAPEYLTGLQQDGAFLGSPDAPFTLIEYADIQCPFCADYARDVLPELVERYVRPGKLRLEYRGLAFLGEDSATALRAVLAAGEQDRLWNVLDGFYARQGGENSGWVTDELVRDVAEQTPGLDVDRMLDDTSNVDQQIARASDQARIDGIQGTPSFLIAPREGGTPSRLEVQELSVAAFSQAIDAAITP